MKLHLVAPALFPTTYINRVKGLQPIAYLPMNETQGRHAYNQGTQAIVGVHSEVQVGGEVGPDMQPASLWNTGDQTSRTRLYGSDLLSNIDPDLGSILMWYKPAWSDNGVKVLIHLNKDGNNYLRIRRHNGVADGYDFQHCIAGTLCDVNIVNSDTDWICLVATWDKANDRVRLYLDSTTPVEDSTMGVWVGAITSAIVGGNTSIGNSPADGSIKHLAIWDRELTAAEVGLLLNIKGHNRSRGLVSRAANAAAALAIDTYDLSDECTHPSVIDFGTDWNGYRYWMALNPLPGGVNTYENPQIMASADGDTWVEPGAIVNPIDAYPGAGFYNSDVNLFYDVGTTTLYCFYRSSDPGPWTGIHYRTSTDGENWSAEGNVVGLACNLVMSPSIMLDGATWKMWTVDESGSPKVVKYRTAAAVTGAWSAATTCTVVLPTYFEPYHLEVIKVGSVYELWVTAYDSRAAEVGMILFRLTSTDGITFTNRLTILQADSDEWDGRYIYKASAQSDGAGGYVIWYGGTDEDNVWKIGKTTVSAL